MPADKHLIARLISGIVSQEFVKEEMYAVCLPASLLLLEHLQKFDIKIICGKMMYDDKLATHLHIWTEIDGVKYDPTIAINREYLTKAGKSHLDVGKFQYYAEVPIEKSFDDFKIMNTFYKVKQTGKIVDYFEESPAMLKTIRNRVSSRIKKMLKQKIKLKKSEF